MAEAKQDQDLQTKVEVAETNSDAKGIKITQKLVPQIIELLKQAVPEWEQFGYMLHVNPVDIDNIKKINIIEPSEKMAAILKRLWNNPELNWADIVKAVRNLGNNALADDLPQSGSAKEIEEKKFVGEMLIKLEEVIPDWEMFGMFMGISNAKLRAIESDLKPGKLFFKLINTWMQQEGDKATTTELEEACRRIGNHALADKVKKWAEEQAAMDPC